MNAPGFPERNVRSSNGAQRDALRGWCSLGSDRENPVHQALSLRSQCPPQPDRLTNKSGE
jgi:hypothetical protein